MHKHRTLATVPLKFQPTKTCVDTFYWCFRSASIAHSSDTTDCHNCTCIYTYMPALTLSLNFTCSQLSCPGSSVGRAMPITQFRIPPMAVSFLRKITDTSGLAYLFSTWCGDWHHWWFNYPGLPLNTRLLSVYPQSAEPPVGRAPA